MRSQRIWFGQYTYPREDLNTKIVVGSQILKISLTGLSSLAIALGKPNVIVTSIKHWILREEKTARLSVNHQHHLFYISHFERLFKVN